jgi:NADH-quinone oxidoreductase subunit J
MGSIDGIVFHASMAASLALAFLIVSRKNPVYSAALMVLFFLSMALDFLILRAPFLAVIQVLVYGGAIMVLYLFVIMLLNLKPDELKEEVSRKRKVASAIASSGVFILLAGAIRSSTKVLSAPPLTAPLPVDAGGKLSSAGGVGAIADELFREHGIAFELTSVLILIAIIGAVYLTKKRGAFGHGSHA